MKDDVPIGVLTESDFVKRLCARDKKASEVIISEIMSNKFRWVNPETEIEDAIQKMLNNNIRRLLILDDDKLVGVLTQTDLTEFLRNKLLVDQTVKNIQKTS
jgi:CBS domain-containing protein